MRISASDLDDDRGRGYGAQQRADLAQAPDVHGVLRDQFGAQAELAPDRQCQQRCHGQGAQTADLHGDQDDQLAREGPVIGRGHHRQPRHGHRGGGREGGVDEGRGAPVVGGPRQPQQQGEQPGHADEDQHGQAGRGGLGDAVEQVAQPAQLIAQPTGLGLGRRSPEGGTHRGASRIISAGRDPARIHAQYGPHGARLASCAAVGSRPSRPECSNESVTQTTPTALFWSPQLLQYDFGDYHPMHPSRLDATWRMIREFGLDSRPGVAVQVPEAAQDLSWDWRTRPSTSGRCAP